MYIYTDIDIYRYRYRYRYICTNNTCIYYIFVCISVIFGNNVDEC